MKKAIYCLIWLILPCVISSSLYAFFYKISYKNTSGETVLFYIKTNAFVGGREVRLNTGWLQQHSTFLSFGSFTVMRAGRYTVEHVQEADTLGQFVFNILGGPEMSTLLHNPDESTGADCPPDNNDVYRINPGVELARTVLPALQMIEGKLARSGIQEISGVNYVNEGNQSDLYVHFITSHSEADGSTMDNASSLADSLVEEGVISGWRHQSQSIRRPVENMLTLVLSGLFAPGSQALSGSSSYRTDRLQILLTRFLEASWDGCNCLVFQVGYSRAVYIALNDSLRESHRRSYDARTVSLFARQIINQSFENISGDIEPNKATWGQQWPPREYSSTLSAEYWRTIERLYNDNLTTVHRNFHHDRQSWRSIRYFRITSVLMTPSSGEFYMEYLIQRLEAVIRDIQAIRRHIDTSGLNLEFRFINIEDEADRTRVNFMLVSYITDECQETDTLQQVPGLDGATSFLTSVMRWSPVSISVQQHASALAVTSAPLSQYFPPAPELGRIPDDTAVPGDTPLEVRGNSDQGMDEENEDCACPLTRETSFMSE
ncbi:hypothetical protein [Endozoicomonas lisbonensis]